MEIDPDSPEAVAARQAAEEAARIEAEKAARLAAIGEAWAVLGERIRSALPSSSNYRQPYLLSLLRQGREAEEQDRMGIAAHCRACIERGLAALETLPATPSTPVAAPSSELASLQTRWEVAARARAAALLDRHAARLAPAEREAYSAALAATASAPAANPQTFRRKLIDRLLRAATYRRRGARLSAWSATRIPKTGNEGPTGPYNDFEALEQTVQRIAATHPEWAAEFLDLYGDMTKIRKAYDGLLPQSKK